MLKKHQRLMPEETPLEELDPKQFTDQLKKLFLSGDRKQAAAKIWQLCRQYESADGPGKNVILDVFEAVFQPADWRPGAAYLHLVLSQAMPVFEPEKNPEQILRMAGILNVCAKDFILFGDYTSAAWAISQVEQMAGAGRSEY